MRPLLLPQARRTPVPAAAPDFATPLGPLAFTAAPDGTALPARPDRLWRLPSGALLARWSGPDTELELLVTAYRPEPLDPARTATGACGALWCLRARREVRPAFTAALTDPPPGTGSGYDGGQHVAALEVDGGGHRLTLHGPDAEAIGLLAATDPDVPTRWAGLAPVGWGEHYPPGRPALHWTLPALPPGEHVLLSASAAWLPADPAAEEDEDDQAARWGALTHPDAILAAAAPGTPEPPGALRRNRTRRASRIGPA
ncbi:MULTISPECIES: hypothetical protein [Kitasatospora]|uniref:Uncharacterized protein n=1 Tax=Kitasatospora setae (strain ATCC 33774 / DSM 43861 / JCM 3304 / KCC A-0304 / NBRC 14216 / KM-6054) TaxID=452652 RepID=E4N6G5_KITSK|nr:MULTISPECIES: hypothetical protein [Kitasatospora]BAJ26796.1 hypothetical protein KSE_09600 [Kitasatospora setae KM-6054]